MPGITVIGCKKSTHLGVIINVSLGAKLKSRLTDFDEIERVH